MAGHPVGRPLPGSAELPRAARRALRRHRRRAGALPKGHFDHAGERVVLGVVGVLVRHAWLGVGVGVGLGVGARVKVAVAVRVRVRVGVGVGVGVRSRGTPKRMM